MVGDLVGARDELVVLDDLVDETPLQGGLRVDLRFHVGHVGRPLLPDADAVREVHAIAGNDVVGEMGVGEVEVGDAEGDVRHQREFVVLPDAVDGAR